MRVFLKTDGRRSLVPGPADLAGRTGVLLIEGAMTDEQVCRWAVAIGSFVGRGGDVRRLT